MFPFPDINLQLKSALRKNIYFTKHQFTVKIGLKDKIYILPIFTLHPPDQTHPQDSQ